MSGSTHFVVVWSKNASKSNWVRAELKTALSTAINKKSMSIIPLRVDETPLPSLLSDIRHIRYAGGNEQDRREIVKAVLGTQPSSNLIKAVVREYNELVFKEDYEGEDPLGHIKACPRCGSTNLKRSMATDYKHDEIYFFLTCKDCGWMVDSQ